MNINGKKILIIEDEPGLVLTLTDRLTNEGYVVTHAGDGLKGETMATAETFDMILFDVMLAPKKGFNIVHDLRQKGITTPMIMLTAGGELNEKEAGLKHGANDYLTKPFEMPELLARIETCLRRPAIAASSVSTMTTYSFGKFTIDFTTMELKQKNTLIELTAREFQLLRYFIEHRGEVLSREKILNKVWGYDAMPTTRTIDTHVTWLRQKLDENLKDPKCIVTIHGFGYKFVG